MKPSIRRLLFFLAFSVGLAASLPAQNAAESFGREDYSRVEKIDIHVHSRTDNTEFAELALQDRFRFMNIAVHSADKTEMEERHRTAYLQHLVHPKRVAMSVEPQTKKGA